MRQVRWVGAAAGAACLVALAACGAKGRPAPEARGQLEGPAAGPALKLAAVAAEEVGLTRELAGTVQPAAVSQVAARIMAQVAAVRVAEGERVEAGQVLVALDDRELQAKVRQAESALRQAEAGRAQAAAQLELAAATLRRFTALLEGHAVSRQEYEQVAAQEAVARAALAQAEAAVAQAAGAVEEAKTWLGFAVIASPVAGRVTAKRIDAGSTAAPGQPLLTIEQEGRHRLELPVDGSLAGFVARSTPLAVAVEAAGYRGTVPVSEVVPAADPVSRTFVVRAELPRAARLAGGQYARVTVALGTRAAVVVPEGALVKRGQLDGVFVATDGRLAFRIVQVGQAASAGKVEVLSGLAVGERIVVEGAAGAVDGSRVSAEAG